MSHDLEYPSTGGTPSWDDLYRARGDEVAVNRPYFTGDVFKGILVRGAEEPRTRTVMLTQHPCALRTNGVDLVSRIVVVEVKSLKLLSREGWRGNLDKMPLPALMPEEKGVKCDQAAFFASPYIVSARDLVRENRIACLSPIGVNLLLQRWVAHNSRVIAPTFMYQKVTAGPYEEVDLTEEWCEERVDSGRDIDDASKECVAWLREPLGENIPVRQEQLADPQRVGGIRKEMRAKLRQLQ